MGWLLKAAAGLAGVGGAVVLGHVPEEWFRLVVALAVLAGFTVVVLLVRAVQAHPNYIDVRDGSPRAPAQRQQPVREVREPGVVEGTVLPEKGMRS
jgi:uncharacterized membrane protein YfcA